ncbi:hypothetical protein RWE15_06015 [Virgibacillus halophilus]|uniref:Uncharacterized protein n=1 Tax=Tigheibacillus halophilus TaxID=361280 RepID=A0ABU5C464_9BACI|nr:hypothetical protein [Virgibacillus halophilus]
MKKKSDSKQPDNGDKQKKDDGPGNGDQNKDKGTPPKKGWVTARWDLMRVSLIACILVGVEGTPIWSASERILSDGSNLLSGIAVI